LPIIDSYNLPLPVLEAIKNRPYTKGESDISATGLISPPRIRQLTERLGDNLEQEAVDHLYALDGSAMHAIFEWAGATLDPERFTLEKRMFAEVDGWTISGQVDVIDVQEKLIQDYKKTSYWVAIYGAKDEWTKQMNIYRWLCHKNGHEINRLEVMAIFRDWKKEQSWRDPEYPKKGFKLMPIDVMSLDETEAYIKERVKLHQEAEALSTEDLPLCSKEEQWSKGSGFAVKLEGAKSARKICDTKKEALEWMAKNIKPVDMPRVNIETREGDPRRCVGYCPVRFHCSYGKGWARK
jgi:hypothetical protein